MYRPTRPGRATKEANAVIVGASMLSAMVMTAIETTSIPSPDAQPNEAQPMAWKGRQEDTENGEWTAEEPSRR